MVSRASVRMPFLVAMESVRARASTVVLALAVAFVSLCLVAAPILRTLGHRLARRHTVLTPRLAFARLAVAELTAVHVLLRETVVVGRIPFAGAVQLLLGVNSDAASLRGG